MCTIVAPYVNQKNLTALINFGVWNEHTEARLREMWAAGISGGEIGLKLGFSKSAIHGKVDRLGLEHRERNNTGNAVITTEMRDRILELHAAGNSIVKIVPLVGICKDRVARVIGKQSTRDRITVRRHVEAAKFHRPLPRPVNLHTLEETDGIFEAMRDVKRYLTHKRAAAPAALPPRTPRRCEAWDGERYKQVQCEGIRDDLRSPYCPDCRALFTVARAA